MCVKLTICYIYKGLLAHALPCLVTLYSFPLLATTATYTNRSCMCSACQLLSLQRRSLTNMFLSACSYLYNNAQRNRYAGPYPAGSTHIHDLLTSTMD